MIMVGNKCDLQRQRSVTNEMIEELKSQLHLTYLETSAKTRQNVDEVFFELVRLIRFALLYFVIIIISIILKLFF
jgi:GTPase SAR1 family protein